MPVISSIDDVASQESIQAALLSTLDAIVFTTENTMDYIPHFQNILRLLRTLSNVSTANAVRPLVIFTVESKDYGPGSHYATNMI